MLSTNNYIAYKAISRKVAVKYAEQSEQKNTEQESEAQNAQPTQDETVSELEQALSEQPTEEPFNQKEQQILNRLNLDPSRVLRYRLNLQHQRNQR